jgi:hypothetical protein
VASIKPSNIKASFNSAVWFIVVSLVGFGVPALGQVGPLDGVTVSSYTINGERPNDAFDTTLTFQSSSNPGFNPAGQLGLSTGDGIASTNWNVRALGADFSPTLPSFGNLIGIEISNSAGSLDLIDTLSGSFILNFSQDFYFEGANLSLGTLANATASTADLTPTVGSTVDLLTTPLGTLFSAGQYTLELAGTVSTAGVETAGLAIQTIAVPEPALSGLFGALWVLLWVAARRRIH